MHAACLHAWPATWRRLLACNLEEAAPAIHGCSRQNTIQIYCVLLLSSSLFEESAAGVPLHIRAHTKIHLCDFFRADRKHPPSRHTLLNIAATKTKQFLPGQAQDSVHAHTVAIPFPELRTLLLPHACSRNFIDQRLMPSCPHPARERHRYGSLTHPLLGNNQKLCNCVCN